MNKKAAIILLSASLAFIIASVILMNTQLKMTNVLGDYQLALVGLQKEEGVYMAYIENAAKFSLAETMKILPTAKEDFYSLCKSKNRACSDDLPKHFRTAFKKHIDSFNIAYGQNIQLENYKFTSKLITLKGTAIELVGVSTDFINIKKGEDIIYKVKPSFKIQANLDDLNKLATTSETIAIAFFNDVVNTLQRCSKINQKTSCYCDDSGFNPNELPEGYHIKISTAAERAQLSKAVEYKFELLYKNDIVKSGGREITRSLMGRFGAHKFFDQDTANKLCYPGIISKLDFIEKSDEKGKLYFFLGDANCAGVSKFSMVEFVKDSELGEVKGPYCSKIGVVD